MRREAIIHIIGMPGSGKTSIANRLAIILTRLNMFRVKHIEVSDVVAWWQAATDMPRKTVYDTELESSDLRAFYAREITDDCINIVSGAREKMILDYTDSGRFPKFIAAIECASAVRRARYSRISKNFDIAENRAIEMNFPKLMCSCKPNVLFVDTASVPIEAIVADLFSNVLGWLMQRPNLWERHS